MKKLTISEILVILFFAMALHAQAARLKDLASVQGVRTNELWGYGVVVGLAGTGDNRHELTQSSLYMALQGMGVDLKAKEFQSRNAAAVVVNASLKPFTAAGGKMDVTVSSIGSSTSLEGGTLLMAPLRGPDGKVYAMAQGRVVTSMRTGKGTKFLRQSLVTAQVPEGATLEKEVVFDFSKQRMIRYALHSPDFTTASRTARRINEELGAKMATAVNAGVVEVQLPQGYTGNPVELAAQIENVSVEADQKAQVVINQRTGTVILGKNVEVGPASVAHNNLRLEIQAPEAAPIPDAGDLGQATPPPRQLSSLMGRDIDNPSGQGSVLPLKGGSTVTDVVESLNQLGAGPDDLILILQSLKAAGALNAEIITR